MQTLTLARTQQIIAAALAHSIAAGYKPMGIAVPIRNAAGELLGAVGASGGAGDEASCIAGVVSAGLVAS